VVAGTDGALFASDWNSHTNARGSGNALGGIFRIAKKGAQINPPKIDFSTTDGLLEALKSPAPGVRWFAQKCLKKKGDAFEKLMEFREIYEGNPYYVARATYVLAQLDDIKGAAAVKLMLTSDDEQWRVLAIRALRMADEKFLQSVVLQMSDDPSQSVRMELLALMRGLEWRDVKGRVV